MAPARARKHACADAVVMLDEDRKIDARRECTCLHPHPAIDQGKPGVLRSASDKRGHGVATRAGMGEVVDAEADDVGGHAGDEPAEADEAPLADEEPLEDEAAEDETA